MKPVLLLSVVYGASLTVAAVARANCNPDNCARAVTGTQRGASFPSTARSDCSSFLAVTVYPSTVTSTVTATVFPTTSTSISTKTTTTVLQTVVASTSYVVASTETDSTVVSTVTVNQKRSTGALQATGTVTPTSVPTYASACSGTVRYSSACSCFGVTATTVTMSTPTTYKTVTVSATAGTTVVSSVAYTSTVSKVVTSSVTTSTTTSLTATATATATGNAYCSNGNSVNGLSPACLIGPCASFNLRIEGATDTIYEGIIKTGPEYITTPSGGTHLCNGQNNNANPSAAGTGITAINDAGSLCGFDFDGTYTASFQDFFISRIGSTSQTATQFWGILLNYQYTPTGGCETEPPAGSDLLWAFDAFNKNNFLKVEPKTATLTVGSSQVFTVTDGQTGNPISGATFNGLITNSQGQVTYVATQAGNFRIKATRSDSIRSNAAMITVT